MRNITICTIVSLIFLCINAQAYVGTGIITEHSEEYRVPLPKNLLNKVQLGTSNANTTATAYEASALANENVTATGYVTYYIVNDTTTNQNYWVDEYMCIDGENCTHIRKTISLNPNLSTEGADTISTGGVYTKKQTHQDEAIVQVTGVSNSYAQGVNNVYIN